jgi:hypothetical protein
MGASTSHIRATEFDQLRYSELVERDASLITARLALGEEEFARVWAEGQAMTLEHAIAYALIGNGA